MVLFPSVFFPLIYPSTATKILENIMFHLKLLVVFCYLLDGDFLSFCASDKKCETCSMDVQWAFQSHLSVISWWCTFDCLVFLSYLLASLLPIYLLVSLCGMKYKHEYHKESQITPIIFSALGIFGKKSTVELFTHFQGSSLC